VYDVGKISNKRFSVGLKENTGNCVALGWGMVTSNGEVNSQSYRTSCCKNHTAAVHGVSFYELKI
jgi:hypothetical protein